MMVYGHGVDFKLPCTKEEEKVASLDKLVHFMIHHVPAWLVRMNYVVPQTLVFRIMPFSKIYENRSSRGGELGGANTLN